jgi:hypothetical protein
MGVLIKKSPDPISIITLYGSTRARYDLLESSFRSIFLIYVDLMDWNL